MKNAALFVALMVGLTAMANADTLSLGDMTFNGQSAADFYGSVTGNDSLNLIKTFEWGADWDYLIKDDSSTSNPTSTFNGIQFTLSANPLNGTSGSWSLTAKDINGSASYNIGDYFDFVGVIKAGHKLAAYYFDNVQLQLANGGNWNVAFTNDKNDTINGLSHLSFYIRENNDPHNDIFPAPEPGSLVLLGSGLLAVAVLKFRKR